MTTDRQPTIAYTPVGKASVLDIWMSDEGEWVVLTTKGKWLVAECELK